jgi:hypothetical protein
MASFFPSVLDQEQNEEIRAIVTKEEMKVVLKSF